MIAQPHKQPSHSPRIVLLSGGTAMTASAKVLAQYTKRSCHFLSPFDSGGSSAEFRRHFALPAVGDLRSRLIALADDSSELHRQRAACLSQRMGAQCRRPVETLLRWQDDADALRHGDSAWNALFEITVDFARTRLPSHFNWAHASLGNLVIAAGMVTGGMDLATVTQQLHQLLQCQGLARCIVDDNLQLKVQLADGSNVVGQHRITGKQTAPLSVAIDSIQLCNEQAPCDSVVCQADEQTLEILQQAALIIFCPGSFYSSLLAQLLPLGVHEAIAKSAAYKLYIPNLGTDPEMFGCSPQQALQKLRTALGHDHLGDSRMHLLIDPSQAGHYADCDIDIHQAAIATPERNAHAPEKLIQAIWTLAGEQGISDL